MGSMDYVLAQINFGRLIAPMDSPLIAEFAAATGNGKWNHS